VSAQPTPRSPSPRRRTAPKLVPVPAPKTRRSPSRRETTAPRPAPPPLRARRRPLAFLVFASLVVGSLVLGLTGLNAVLAQGSFLIADLSHRVDRLQQEFERKQLEVAKLSAPARISREAAGLGMVLPDPHHVRVIHARGGAAG
jgi:cell division protein FtsL